MKKKISSIKHITKTLYIQNTILNTIFLNELKNIFWTAKNGLFLNNISNKNEKIFEHFICMLRIMIIIMNWFFWNKSNNTANNIFKRLWVKNYQNQHKNAIEYIKSFNMETAWNEKYIQ